MLTLRKRSGHVVRLEVDTTMTDDIRELLVRELELSDDDVSIVDGPLDLSGLWGLQALDRPELKDEPWVPQTQAVLTRTDPPPDLFRLLQSGDVLVHHPYDSFATSVAEFVDQAARDPQVLAIKQTLYRTGGQESGDHRVARARRRGGQAGGRARRDQGALRRGGQRRARPRAGRGRRPRRVRHRRAQDAHQGAARRARRAHRRPALLPRRAPATTTR